MEFSLKIKQNTQKKVMKVVFSKEYDHFFKRRHCSSPTIMVYLILLPKTNTYTSWRHFILLRSHLLVVTPRLYNMMLRIFRFPSFSVYVFYLSASEINLEQVLLFCTELYPRNSTKYLVWWLYLYIYLMKWVFCICS